MSGQEAPTRYESSVTSVSWIPREAVEGMTKLPFQVGAAHYDLPPPDHLEDIQELHAREAFRFANELRGWIQVHDDRIVSYGQAGHGYICNTRMMLGPKEVVFPAVAYPDRRDEPRVGPGAVTFTQTAGGRTGAPFPRRVRHKPFFQITAPTAWTKLALTLKVDGSSSFEILAASPFPRHWVFDGTGRLAAKSGFIDFEEWGKTSFNRLTPWGEENSRPLIMQAESALERELSSVIIGSNPPFRRLEKGDVLVREGERGKEVYLLFDGVMTVERDGEPVAELGPGAVLGEMAVLSGGVRTATVRAVTSCRVAVVPGDRLDREALERIAEGRRAERTDSPDSAV
jgi:Cyclic nucleotide-binding domain